MKSRRRILLLFISGWFAFFQTGHATSMKEFRARNFFNQGWTYLQEQSYEAAIRKFLDCLKINSADNRVRYFLGEAFYKAGYTQNALEQWENIVKLGGQDAHLIEKINQIHYLQGKAPRRQALDDYVLVSEFPKAILEGDRHSLTYPMALHIDDEDLIYVLDYKKSQIGMIDGNGRYLGIFFGGIRSVVPGMAKLRHPLDILFLSEGRFLVSDFDNNRLVVVEKNKGIVSELGKKGVGSIPLSSVEWVGPSGLARDEKGNLFVSDTGNSRIQYINEQGLLLYSFGRRGQKEGELYFPSGLAYDRRRQQLYVCDRGNNRIAVFGSTGDHRFSLGESFLNKPRKIVIHPSHESVLFIADVGDVYLYDIETKRHKSVFYNVGAVELEAAPTSIAIDRSGLLYVSHASRPTIQVFSPIKLTYVNLIVRTEAIDIRRFPKVVTTVSVRNREGIPLSGLSEPNFSLLENGIERPYRLIIPSSKYEAFRAAVLVEQSSELRDRLSLAKACIRDLFSELSAKDALCLYGYGGKNKRNRGEHRQLIDYNRSSLSSVDALVNAKTFSYFQVGTLLKRTINEQIQGAYKRGIILLAFSDYTSTHFAPEAFQQLVDFARHNFVPISVIYLGESPSSPQGFALLKSLPDQTGGQFLIYKTKTDIQNMIHHFKSFQKGIYHIEYTSFDNDIKSGLFRSLVVKANYKGMSGADTASGFPIP